MKNRSFRPIKLADSLQGVNKSLENKFGKINFVIYSKWAEIVGTFFAKHSEPEKITTIPKPAIDGEIEFQVRDYFSLIKPLKKRPYLSL